MGRKQIELSVCGLAYYILRNKTLNRIIISNKNPKMGETNYVKREYNWPKAIIKGFQFSFSLLVKSFLFVPVFTIKTYLSVFSGFNFEAGNLQDRKK